MIRGNYLLQCLSSDLSLQSGSLLQTSDWFIHPPLLHRNSPVVQRGFGVAENRKQRFSDKGSTAELISYALILKKKNIIKAIFHTMWFCIQCQYIYSTHTHILPLFLSISWLTTSIKFLVTTFGTVRPPITDNITLYTLPVYQLNPYSHPPPFF